MKILNFTHLRTLFSNPFLLSQLQVNKTYRHLFFPVQQHLTIDEPALYLLKNIIRLGGKGSHVFETSLSMFSDTLNDDIIIKPDTHYRSKNKSEKRNQIYKTLASSISKEYLKFDMPLYLSSDSSIAQVFRALKIRNAFTPPFLFLCNQYIPIDSNTRLHCRCLL